MSIYLHECKNVSIKVAAISGLSDVFLGNHHKAQLISRERKKMGYNLCHFFEVCPKEGLCTKIRNYNTDIAPGVSELYVCRQ